MEEIWKPIKDYEGYYEVSNLGEVKSIDRYVGEPKIFKKGVLMTQQIDKGGYYRVVLQKQGKSRTKMISRLVAKAFIPNPNNLPFVNHKDENKNNNCVDNLEWCTRKYNNNYGTRNERARLNIMKKVAKCDLNGNVIEIYDSVLEAKEKNKFGTHISEVCNGKRKTAYGYLWKHI